MPFRLTCTRFDSVHWSLQVLQGILDQPQEGSGAIEKQSVRAQALLMQAKVHKVCNPVCTCCLIAARYVSTLAASGESDTQGAHVWSMLDCDSGGDLVQWFALPYKYQQASCTCCTMAGTSC